MINRRTVYLRVGSLAVALAALSGCGGTWFGDSGDPPLPGQRIAVSDAADTLISEPGLAGAAIQISAPNAGTSWTMADGNARANPDHPALSYPLSPAWSVGVGTGASSDRRMTSRPIVAGGAVYAMDAEGRVTAVDASSGAQRWRVRVADPNERGRGMAGGLAFADGRLFATTGFGEIVAVDPANGGLIWTRKIGGPIRGAPTVSGNSVYAITSNNELHAVSVSDGQSLWSHVGIEEATSILGGASPTIAPGVVVAPYSSGEIYAVRQETGLEVWSDSVAALRSGSASVSDVTSSVVIDGPIALASGQSGRMIALDVRSGGRIWEQQAGGLRTPWIDGNTIYSVNASNQLAALSRDDGRVRWTRQLERYSNPGSRSGAILWSGPVLAGGRLVVAGSHGELIIVDPRSGEIESVMPLRNGVSVAPVVANGTLYVLDDSATLTAFR